MKKILAIILGIFVNLNIFAASVALPDSIFSGLQGKHHVQGVAVDTANGKVFFSFTTRLVVTDLKGQLLGSIDGLTGHLGCMAFNPADGRLYASIEYKNDVIGTGIAGEEAARRDSKFYIAVFNPEKIVRPDMSAEGIMELIELPEVAADYKAKVYNGGRLVEHRYGCSGIDGIAFAPLPGKPGSAKKLYIAYGIYGDTTRTDNDYQVLNCYDVEKRRLLQRYFVYTGNTTWGIQNLCYNPGENCLLAAVYQGKKNSFPNYSLFAIDLNKKPRKEALRGFDSKEKQLVLSLCEAGQLDEASGIRGWNFKYGSTGLCSLGDSLFYISHNSSKPEQNTTIRLYRWSGAADKPFELVNPLKTTPKGNGLVYHSLRELPLLGTLAPDASVPYTRLPDSLRTIARKPVWELGQNSAGLVIRFRSDASDINLCWLSSNNSYMSHMSPTGSRGLDLYVLGEDSVWTTLGCARPNRHGVLTDAEVMRGMEPRMREYMLYLSLYNGVDSIAIGVDSAANVLPPSVDLPRRGKPVVMYGTSILQGACASRPGLAHTNILMRELQREVVNLGFSGNALLDPEIARFMAQADASLFVIDAAPNCSPDLIDKRLEDFIAILRASHPATPILLVGSPVFPATRFKPALKALVEDKNKRIGAIYKRLSEKDANIHYFEGADVLGDNEFTVDNTHFNDAGFAFYADAILPVIKQLIK